MIFLLPCIIGPVTYFTVAGQGILVLNNHEAANALLDGRGLIYADRPKFTRLFLHLSIQFVTDSLY